MKVSRKLFLSILFLAVAIIVAGLLLATMSSPTQAAIFSNASSSLSEGSATAEVVTGALNVRYGPGIAHGKITVVYSGQIVSLIGRNDSASWVKIRLDDGLEGWINASFIHATIAINDLPVMDSPQLILTATVATGAMSVRHGPGVGYDALAIAYNGQSVTLLGRNNSGSWVKVRLNDGQEGWSNASLITTSVTIKNLPVVDFPALTPIATVATHEMNVRQGPGVAYASITVVSYGQRMTLLGRNNSLSWVKVRLGDGQEGWVNASLIQANVSIGSLPIMSTTAAISPVGTVNTGALNVRVGPGANYDIVTVVYLGHSVKLIGRNNGSSWVKIQLANEQTGWVNASFIWANVSINRLPVTGL